MARTLHIVAADNDPGVCRFYQQFLPTLGHQVCVAQTGRQLAEQCRLLHPDVVIAGVSPPDLDGLAAAEEICRDRPAPVILVPGCYAPELVGSALANPHIMACLFQPVKVADLAAAIAVSLRRFEQWQSLAGEAADLRQALEDRKLVERAKGALMRHVGVDEPEAFRRLRKLASDQNRKLAEVAQDILAAAEVFQQLESPPHGEKPGAGHAGRGQRTGRTSGGGRATVPGRAPVAPNGHGPR